MLKVDDPESFKELPVEQQEYLIDWINKNVKQSYLKFHSSYSLKHLCPTYFTNGQFKGAMLACGYEAIDKNKQNWGFRYRKTKQPNP